MPAVQLTHLKIQIEQLAWRFNRPVEFQRSLHALLDTYADRTFRPGPDAKNAAIAHPAYHVSPVVLKQLEFALSRWAAQNGPSAILLADTLWNDPALEPRLLAAYLLGAIPIGYIDEVSDRLSRWAAPNENRVFLRALFIHGTTTLRRHKPQDWQVKIKAWLSDPQISRRRIGLLAALSLIEDLHYPNLPAIFNSLGSVVQTHPAELQNELFLVITALGNRSPIETVYFLRQMIGLDPNPGLVRLIRRCLPEFPPEIQKRMLDLLHSLPKNPSYRN